MLSNRVVSAALVVVGASVSACHSMAHVRQPTAPDGKPVEIRFASARNIDGVNPDGSRRSLAQVTKASGSITAVRPDSLTVRIASWKRNGDKGEHFESLPLHSTFAVADPEVGYYQRRFSKVKTLVLVGSIVGALALAAGQASLATPGNIGGAYDVLHFLP